jgi:hypothetical protein
MEARTSRVGGFAEALVGRPDKRQFNPIEDHSWTENMWNVRESSVADEHRLKDRLMVTAARASACLNCGSPLTGAFCADCGQRDIPPYPSVRELVVDAAAEFRDGTDDSP